MKIAIDCDDVLADSISMLKKQHNLMFPDKPVPDNLAPIWQEWNRVLDKETVNQLYNVFLQDSFILSLLPKHDSIMGVRELSRLGCEIVIVTSRVSKVAKATRQWTNKYFGDMISEVFHLTYDGYEQLVGKEDICRDNQISLLVDDHPYVIEAMTRDGIKTLLYDCPWNKDVSDGPLVTRVKNWHEIVNYVRKIC